MASGSNSTTLATAGGYANGFTLSISWNENSTSTSNNTSNITATATLSKNKAIFSVTGAGILRCYWHDNRTNSDDLVAEGWIEEIGYTVNSRSVGGTFNRTHKDDGTLSGYAWAQWEARSSYGGYPPVSGSVGTGWTALTTIPRASTPSVSPSTFNIGDTITINTNRASSSFTHTITLTFGSYSYTVGTGVGGSTTLNTSNIASNLYAQIPSATSGTGTITCVTYNGSTNIGTKTCSFTAKAVEANVKPTFSNFTYQDTNSTITAITGNNQYLVQGKSSLRVTISSANKAVANQSATMNTYNASISGLSASANYSTSDLNINFSENSFAAGTQALAVRATDSRGYSTTVSKNVNVLAYAAPVINASATRLNNFENQTTLKVSGTYSPLTINNTAKNTVSSVQYRYKAQSTSTWGSWTTMSGLSVTSAGAYSVTDKVLDLDNNTSYDFEVKTTDKLGSTTVSLTVSVGIPILRIGVNDGLLYNKEQPLMPSHVGQVIMSTTLDTAAKVKAIYGGTWERWGAGKVPVGVDPNDSDFNAPNKSGGAKTVTLTVEQIPNHKHPEYLAWDSGTERKGDYFQNSVYGWSSNKKVISYTQMTGYTGGGKSHNNMQPYITLYMWRRTA